MTTLDQRLRIYDKAFITTLGLGNHFFDFLHKFTRDGLNKIWPNSGVFGTGGILSSLANDALIVSPFDGIWNHGRLCSLPIQNNVPFENAVGDTYFVGAKFNEYPSAIAINALTANPEYILVGEGVGELDKPLEVFDNGNNTLTIVVDNIFEAGVDNTGRTVRVWLTIPQTTTSGWFELATVQFGTSGIGWIGNKNYIVTAGNLGQGTISTIPDDYKVMAEGISIFKNKDLSDRGTYPEYIYFGNVLGNGPAAVPVIINTGGVIVYYPIAEDIENLMRFIGKPVPGPIMPSYASTNYVSQGDDLVGAISDLDERLHSIATMVDLNAIASIAVVADSMADRAESMARLASSVANIGVVAMRSASYGNQVSWTFTHMLTTKKINVQCFIGAGYDELAIPAKVYMSPNTVVVKWSDPLAGVSVAGRMVVMGKPGA